MSAPLGEELLRARLEHQRFEPPRLRGRRSQAEVAPAIVVRIRGGAVARLLDQSVGEHRAQRPVEIARHDLIEAAALLDFPHQVPPVPLLIDQREQDLEYQRLQRLWGVWRPARRHARSYYQNDSTVNL